MLYGGYGVTVNTEACGAFNSGSIPDSHPSTFFSKISFYGKDFLVLTERGGNWYNLRMSLERPGPRKENPPRPNIEIETGFQSFVPEDFQADPIKYFEEKGINIKSGEVQTDEEGKVREDPTAVKELPVWTNSEGQKLSIVAKRVNVEKSQVGETGDPFHEYKIMEIAREFDLPAPKPIAKVEQQGNHLILMEKVNGFRWTEKDAEALKEAGLTEEDKSSLLAEAEKLMSELEGRFSEVGLVRKWKLKDMIFDIDMETKTLRSITPTDWERTKIDQDKLLEAKSKRSGI